MTKLDLGCGFAKEKGAFGVDRAPLPGVDVVLDLQRTPYPFAQCTFDTVIMNDVIEHLPDTVRIMEEVYRILKPDGRALIRVVNWTSHYAFMDPTHLCFFTEHSFDFFGSRPERDYYSSARFRIVSIGYQYSEEAKHLFRHPRLLRFFSRFFNNVLEGLHFELQAVKTEVTPIISDQLSLSQILRCPECLNEQHEESLIKLNPTWLACKRCNRRFPSFRDIPFFLPKYFNSWTGLPLPSLPVENPVSFPSVEKQTNNAFQVDPPKIYLV